jgi:glycine hydroxymethyltransferase
VREALSTAFHNIYAEGYPEEASRFLNEEEILDYKERLAYYRRYSDPRYYKGVEYANIMEALARRRCAETFATDTTTADDIYVNVQSLSGAPANNAVYHALVEPGDSVMGMDLLHGGHLSHGSPVNRSGKFYNIIHYKVEKQTEKIDYQSVADLARQYRPKIIIGGFSSYPWQADWKALRAIADEIGAYLLADISHVSGLVISGIYPSPIGHAHVITATTHKTLNGPRGAIILTTDRVLSRKLDRAVFPGEQGGPHVNVFAALAVAFKIAQTNEFKDLQRQVVANCIAFTKHLEEHGFRIPYGGTNTHLMNLDCKSITGPDGTALSGDMAARILDLAGIVVNRNTIPGDSSALNPSGIRMGTSWVTQRGFKEKEILQLADIIADLLKGTTPYTMPSKPNNNQRAKVDFDTLENARMRVRDLALSAGIDFDPPKHHYPHFYYLDDIPGTEGDSAVYELGGERIRQFLNYAFTSDVEALEPGQKQATSLITPKSTINGTLNCTTYHSYQLSVPSEDGSLAANWLRNLSDGFMPLDDDILQKSVGPVWIQEIQAKPEKAIGDPVSLQKPYYIGISGSSSDALPEFVWEDEEPEVISKTPLNEIHRSLGAKMVPFAGWDMPVWYTSVIEEHLTVRQAAGLFDVSHMGVYQAEGPDAVVFLDSVCGNDISSLAIDQSLYTHFLDPYANVIDDLLVYRRGTDKYLIVVNAANDDKDWAWLSAVKNGEVMVDHKRPWAQAYGRKVNLRNLRDTKEGPDMLVDLALQGPRSRDILLALECDQETRKRIRKLKRTELCEANLEGIDLVISRTGYTGERMAFELFVHPERSGKLWNKLLAYGESFGLKPIGLGARDSLRTEAGLPLYGHEMGGDLNLCVGDAGFRSYVKTYKPWFIGRNAFLEKESQRKSVVIRFRFTDKGVRMAHLGDPVVDKRGRVIGQVTSCAVDSDGFLTGQAYIDQKYAAKDTTIFIFQSASKKASKPPADLTPGDRIPIPTPALVLSRFPKL